LLLLRELRADRWAAQHLDGLLLAESLLALVSSNMQSTEVFTAAFGSSNNSDRLEERINFLLAEPEPLPQLSLLSFFWLSLSLLPLALLPFHENIQLFSLS
jgi:Zn-dependent protease with chaperone function